MKHNLTTMRTMLVGMVTVWCSCSFAQQHPNILWYDKPAQYWEEALPLGNGRIGAMVYGNPSNEEIQLNEETISADFIPQIVQCLFQKDIELFLYKILSNTIQQ